jgi:hypothetical protein
MLAGSSVQNLFSTLVSTHTGVSAREKLVNTRTPLISHMAGSASFADVRFEATLPVIYEEGAPTSHRTRLRESCVFFPLFLLRH